MAKILITGVSGFLGSAIAEKFASSGHSILGLKRSGSDLWRCKEFEKNITWINIDEEGWKNSVLQFSPSVFIHSAWSGVSARDRQNWLGQSKNLYFLIELLELADSVKADKFIGFGSQAEYGEFSGEIDENYPLNPTTAYGLNKVLAMQTIKCFAEQAGIKWHWLRLFSFFGEKEDQNWFIPSVVNNIANQKVMDMTPGDQQYAYMYIKDLACLVEQITFSSVNNGDYNICSATSRKLRSIVEKIVDIIDPEAIRLINLGAIPYRPHQPMLLKGSTKKLEEQIGKIFENDFDMNLQNVVQFILNAKKS